MIEQAEQTQLVLATAEQLKKKIKMPDWARFVKTGCHRETMPKNPDWWYIRAASILRVVHNQGPVGVGKLRTRYGGRQNRGVRPDHFRKAGGKVIRTMLQQLQEAGLIQEAKKDTYKGRVTTADGIALLASAAKVN